MEERLAGTIDLLIEHGAPPEAITAHCYHFRTGYSESYDVVAPLLKRSNLICLHRAVGMDGVDEFERSGVNRERPVAEAYMGEIMPTWDEQPENCEGVPVVDGDGYSYSRYWKTYHMRNMTPKRVMEEHGL